MRTLVRLMKALSDPNRIKIIKLLEQKELCVCEIQALLGLAQSTVSKHLKILEEADLVDFRKQGSWIHYSLGRKNGSPEAAAMLRQMQTWVNDDEEILLLLEKIPHVDALRSCAA